MQRVSYAGQCQACGHMCSEHGLSATAEDVKVGPYVCADCALDPDVPDCAMPQDGPWTELSAEQYYRVSADLRGGVVGSSWLRAKPVETAEGN